MQGLTLVNLYKVENPLCCLKLLEYQKDKKSSGTDLMFYVYQPAVVQTALGGE